MLKFVTLNMPFLDSKSEQQGNFNINSQKTRSSTFLCYNKKYYLTLVPKLIQIYLKILMDACNIYLS